MRTLTITNMKFEAAGDLTRENLEVLRAQIDELLASSTLPEQAGEGASPSPTAQAKAKALWDRIGDASWGFIHTAAERYESDEEFTFQDIAAVMNVDVDTVKSWHRNMSRSMKRINAEHGDEPEFLLSRWDGFRQHYRMPKSMRAAIRALGAR